MIKSLLHDFIKGLKPFIIISLIVGIFIGVICLAMISDIFWGFLMAICIIGFICGLGRTRK